MKKQSLCSTIQQWKTVIIPWTTCISGRKRCLNREKTYGRTRLNWGEPPTEGWISLLGWEDLKSLRLQTNLCFFLIFLNNTFLVPVCMFFRVGKWSFQLPPTTQTLLSGGRKKPSFIVTGKLVYQCGPAMSWTLSVPWWLFKWGCEDAYQLCSMKYKAM